MHRTTRWVAGAAQLAVLSVLMSCKDLPTDSAGGGGKTIRNVVGCRVEVATGNTVCEPLSPEGKSLGQASLNVIADAQWMVETQAGAYTRADSTYRFNLRVTNDTESALGTPDGTQATGLKVFLPVRVMGYARQPGNTSDPYGMLIPAIQNTNNTVHARNPDGIASFTAADQPYWHYPQILQPWESTDWKEWQFTVDPGVAYFYFAVSIFTHVPGAQPVASTAPDGWLIPEDSVTPLFEQQNLIIAHPRMSGPYPRNLVLIAFKPEATADEKQAAVDQVGGTVVGGDGAHYYVHVTDGAEPVWLAVDRLSGLPQIEHAVPYVFAVSESYLRPNNGTGWQRADWEVHPDSSRGRNWGPEAMAVPSAWGCETGSSAIKVAVVDPGTDHHGGRVAAIFSNAGDTGNGTAGVMWSSDMFITAGSDSGTVGSVFKQDSVIRNDLRRAIRQRSRVINLSWGTAFVDSATGKKRPAIAGKAADINLANTVRRVWRARMVAYEDGVTPASHPLYVISAGNDAVDALYSGLPQLATDARFKNRVIVVAAHDSTRAGSGRTLSSFSNTGSLVTVAAPGSELHFRTAAGTDWTSQRGTSFAAPHVAGLAGLLFSQVPTRDAETVRSYIIEGATRGGRKAGGYPMANAYESLKRGAEDQGAPLCGNRVWAEGAQVWAQRGSGKEAIGPADAGGDVSDLLTQHGGRAIVYNNTAQQGKALLRQADGTWAVGGIPADWSSKAGGSTLSEISYSHGIDSLVEVTTSLVNNNQWWRSGSQASVPVVLYSAYGSPTTLGTLTIPNVPIPETRMCAERVPNGSCTYTLISGRYWLFRVSFPQAYQPVLITVTGWYSSFKEPEPWRTCTRDPSLECRNVPSELLWTPATVYRLPIKGGTPVKVAELPDPVFWIGQTEVAGSDSLVMGTGRWISEYLFNPDTRSQPRTKNEIPNCAIEYRSLATIQTVGQRIANPNTCYWSSFTEPEDFGGGTFSPIRAPVTPFGGTPPNPREMRIDVGEMLRTAGDSRRR
jgi:thermitase